MLFRLDRVRFGTVMALRARPADGDGTGGAVAPWRLVDLRAGLLGIDWRPGSGRHGDDGRLALAAGGTQWPRGSSSPRRKPRPPVGIIAGPAGA